MMSSHDQALAVVGMRQEVPVLGGGMQRYINLDNAASTPPLVKVHAGLERFVPWYSSVHRGSGFKSQLATEALDQAREVVLRFVGADPATHTAIFGTNTTEALNRLAALLPLTADDVVLSTGMEHHANDLPWRAHARVEHVAVTREGLLDLADLQQKLAAHAGRVRLVAVSGAANVTGLVNPIHKIAEMAHAHGAQIAVDAAQLAPHRAIRMAQERAAASIDYLALSGHKLYAPYGAGALIAPLAVLEQVRPDRWGGGAVEVVTPDAVYLAGPMERHEPGSPNVIGVVAMALAMQALMEAGMERLDEHEQELTAYALRQMREVPGLRLYGLSDPERVQERLGVIPFNVGDLPHGLVAAILAQEAGVGVRNGCFCAHPYVTHLLGVDAHEQADFQERVLAGDRSVVPGMVRASLGCYSTRADVDALVAALHRIARGEYRQGYRVEPATGDYGHPEYQPEVQRFFSL